MPASFQISEAFKLTVSESDRCIAASCAHRSPIAGGEGTNNTHYCKVAEMVARRRAPAQAPRTMFSIPFPGTIGSLEASTPPTPVDSGVAEIAATVPSLCPRSYNRVSSLV